MIGVLLLFVLSLSAYAQIGPTGGASIVPTTANPAGLACTRTSVRLLTPAGTIYTCDSTGHYAAVGSSSGSGSIAYAVGGGAAQAQAATYSPAITLTAGQWACWLPLAANSGSGATFAPNGLTAHTIVKQAGAALAANDIITTAIACAVYDTTGTQWELQNPQTTAAAGVAIQVNGSATGLGTTANFNGTTPAAAAGNQNVTFQVSGTSISAEVPTPAYLAAINAIGTVTTTQTIACTGGGVQSLTLTAATALVITMTQPSGTTCLARLEITQAAGGTGTVTIAGAKWPSGIAPVMTSTASAIDIWSCLLDGTTSYCTVGQNFQ